MRCGYYLFQFACLALIALGLGACSDQIESKPENFVAYSWSPTSEHTSNIIPFYWLKSSDADNLEDFVARAVEHTERMPVGHRVLFSWDIHRMMMSKDNGDFLYSTNGDVAGCNSEDGFTPYRSVWLDNGVEKVRQFFAEFFRLYSEAGGHLDVFVLDYEQGFSYWHLLDLVEKNYSCGIDHYLDAIQNDSRFADLKEVVPIEDLKSMTLWYENDDHLKWLSYVWPHLANYIDNALYQPLKMYYPDVEFSNYGYYYQQAEFDFPDIYGSDKQKYTKGIHVGTHQSRELYGWMNLPTGTALDGVEYAKTPFNALRFAVNKLRAMLLSSTMPVSPWVAYKGFDQSHLHNNDYYQELIFHTLLSGVDYLLYWNPSQQADFSDSDDRLLDQLMTQVNTLINDREIIYLTDNLVNWLDEIMITKVQLQEDVQLWRLTADIGIDETIEDLVVESSPAKIKVNDTTYTFDEMKVLPVQASMSDKGLWLISN